MRKFIILLAASIICFAWEMRVEKCLLANTFENCTGLTSVTIHNSIKSIGVDAFENCSNVQITYAE